MNGKSKKTHAFGHIVSAANHKAKEQLERERKLAELAKQSNDALHGARNEQRREASDYYLALLSD